MEYKGTGCKLRYIMTCPREGGGAAMRVEILHEDVVSLGGARGRVFVLCR